MAHPSSETVAYDARGVRKAAAKLGRKMVPAFQIPERKEDESTKREAYQMALSNRHKPWARRYLRSGGRLW